MILALSFALPVALQACGQLNSDFLNADLSEASEFLYVASGACYGGGVTTATGSGTIAKFSLTTGAFISVVKDYSASGTGDQPVGMSKGQSGKLVVLIENATSGRRIETVNTDGSGSNMLFGNTNLNGVLRWMSVLSDGGYLISKSTAIEKFAPSTFLRFTQGANPFINAPAGSCATSTTLIPAMAELSNGKLLYTHAAATPNNKWGIIASTGYSVAGDCLNAQTAPATTALPTSILVHSSGKVIVAYGSTTTASNFVYAYDVNVSTNAISGATASYSNASVVNGPSSMVEIPSSGQILVANALSTANSIERFSFDSSTKLMTRVGTSSVTTPSVFTRCVSAMVVAP